MGTYRRHGQLTYLSPTTGKTTAMVIIPVVVHVICTSAGAANDVSVAQIQSQIDVLNEDYQHMTGTPGFGADVDMEIHFCLATLDPSGLPTTGIKRTTSAPE